MDHKGASDEQAFFIGALSRNKCTENDKRRSTYHSRLTMQLICNVIPESICKEVGIVCGSKKGSKLLSHSGHEIKTLGKSDVVVEYKGKYHVIEF